MSLGIFSTISGIFPNEFVKWISGEATVKETEFVVNPCEYFLKETSDYRAPILGNDA